MLIEIDVCFGVAVCCYVVPVMDLLFIWFGILLFDCCVYCLCLTVAAIGCLIICNSVAILNCFFLCWRTYLCLIAGVCVCSLFGMLLLNCLVSE